MKKIPKAWLYPDSLAIAADVQKELAQRVITTDDFPKINYLGGMDVSNNPYDPDQMVYATIVTLDAKTLQIIETASINTAQKFP